MATKTRADTGAKAGRNRAETERRLIDTALDLIGRKGVLAGLNLREVADGAGVNRASIYHHFGSRRDLMRTAIARRFEAVSEHWARDERKLAFTDRILEAFRMIDRINDSRLRALLVIDGDDSVDPMPRYEEALSDLRLHVIEGEIDHGHDLEATQVALSSLARGYRIFREQYAKRTHIDVDDLDERVAGVLRSWLEAMERPPAAHQDEKE